MPMPAYRVGYRWVWTSCSWRLGVTYSPPYQAGIWLGWRALVYDEVLGKYPPERPARWAPLRSLFTKAW